METSIEEKGSNLPSPLPNKADSVGSGGQLEWTEEEERALVRRVDFLLMPLLILGFFVLQLDRGNIGNALTDFFLEDVGVTQNQFNVGQQLLSLGIILLEIPSNIVLYRIGPTFWISGQIIAWGLVATFQAFQKGQGAFLATRILLGLRMRGIAGLTGWQWLFILEGIFTILVGIAFLFTIPQATDKPFSILGYRYFTERESAVLTERVLRDDPSKAQPKRHVSWSEIKAVLKNWRLLPHIGLTITGLAPNAGFDSYAPTLITGLGFDRIQSNALVSISKWLMLFTILFWGWIATLRYNRTLDIVGIQYPTILYTLCIDCGMLALAYGFPTPINTSGTVKITLTPVADPVNGAWLSLNTQTAGERSITMAIHIMAANSSSLVGKQIFRSEDSPVYRRAWLQIVCLSSAAVIFSVLANLQYYLGNGRKLHRSGLRFYY
ncbi:hypothetical protein jhhlp_005474 [Lomentospora prolificans]|uniref:Major facilitator superfamily (MFS) profile domain-containing protein n=1 Tax=Lomentospora prolificans TaxID=41688 RepID=A0A2N3N6Y9_9PEZI|nr:hypothetical protein jhhlp_005474 [Lomentospora prolificans]